LYDKPTHFLLELIQNADDCKYDQSAADLPEMDIKYDRNHRRLRVDYNEMGFEKRDVEAICRIGRSTKAGSSDQIGEKGIGFKSVFKVADVVHISSGHYCFKFDRTQDNLGMVTPEWTEFFPGELLEGRTSILLEVRGDFNDEDLCEEMRLMDPRCLLFLRNLKQIYILLNEQDNTKLERELSRLDEKGRAGNKWETTLSHGVSTDTGKDVVIPRKNTSYVVYKQTKRAWEFYSTGFPKAGGRGYRPRTAKCLRIPSYP
jgi:hypothetical protein